MKNAKKLVLNHETLCILSEDETAPAAGGVRKLSRDYGTCVTRINTCFRTCTARCF